MTNIFIDPSVTLQHWSQISKCVIHTTCPSKLTSPSSELSSLNWHLIYSILVLLNLKPFDSKICFHNSSFWLTLILILSISITSSAKSMHQGTSSYMSFIISFITKVKIYEFNADPWCNPILIENISELPSHALTQVTTFLYISLITVTYSVGTRFFSSVHHIIFFGILSRAFSKSINIICRFFFYFWNSTNYDQSDISPRAILLRKSSPWWTSQA
jgi:hypothetical protein